MTILWADEHDRLRVVRLGNARAEPIRTRVQITNMIEAVELWRPSDARAIAAALIAWANRAERGAD